MTLQGLKNQHNSKYFRRPLFQYICVPFYGCVCFVHQFLITLQQLVNFQQSMEQAILAKQ